jgi:hypothetical protein
MIFRELIQERLAHLVFFCYKITFINQEYYWNGGGIAID